MSTGPETEVISCPACNHLLRVPLDWLGVQVQCPECKALFKAPAPDGKGGFTAAELISRPPTPGGARRRRMDPMLLLPAFGLMMLGVAGLAANGILAYKFATDPVGGKAYIRDQVAQLRQYGFGADDPPGEQDRLDDERAEQMTRLMKVVLPVFAAVNLVVFAGGLAMATRRNYRLAQLGCVAAILNVPHLCCVPGSVAGVWGLLMLGSEEGRAHFGK